MQTLRPFQYYEPQTVNEAARILSEHATKARILAGGMDLLPRMRRRDMQPECIVYIQNIPQLDFIESNGNGFRFGALTSLHSLELSPLVKRDYPVLWEAIHQIAPLQVKVMGTAIGNLCVATPASDVASALFVLGAKIKITNLVGERVIPIEDFYFGVKQTVLQPGDIVTEVSLPAPPAGAVSAFLKLGRTAHDLAKVNVAVSLILANSSCKEAKVALGSVAPTTIRAKKAEEILIGQRITPEIVVEAANIAAAETTPIDDYRSTADYRKEMTKVLVKRAVEKAIERAKG